MSFHIASSGPGPTRVGKLTTKSGVIDTPGFCLYTQRGSVPHLTVDNVKRATDVSGIQLPIHNVYDVLTAIAQPNAPTLSKFLNLDSYVLFLNLRDCICTPPDEAKAADGVLVSGAGGKKKITLDDYVALVHAANPDIVEALFETCAPFATNKQQVKATEKTAQWTRDFVAKHHRPEGQMVFGVISGGDCAADRQAAAKAMADIDVQGFSIEGLGCGGDPAATGPLLDAVVRELPADKPRAIYGMGVPELVLQCVSKGVDLFDGSFPYQMSEAGFALTFAFGASSAAQSDAAERCIGLWDTAYVRDNGPLLKGCGCFTCANHTRAYIHHLLNTHEMLAEVLLMMHNTHHYARFFEAIRAEIMAGTFDQSAARFVETYG